MTFLDGGGEGDYGMNRLMNGRQRWFVRVIIEWQRWCAVTWVRLIDRLFVQIDQRLQFFFPHWFNCRHVYMKLDRYLTVLIGTDFRQVVNFSPYFFIFNKPRGQIWYLRIDDDDDVRFQIFKRSISSILLQRKERLVTHNYLFIFTASEI